MDESKIISYIISILNNPDLALRIASRCNLPGAEKLYMDKFMQLLQSGSYNEAAKVAANSPQVRLINSLIYSGRLLFIVLLILMSFDYTFRAFFVHHKQ